MLYPPCTLYVVQCKTPRTWYVGTTLREKHKRFQEHFDRFQIVKGEMIPPGHRGVLLSTRTYERFLKHRVARELDKIKKSIEQEGKSLEDDELLQAQVRRWS